MTLRRVRADAKAGRARQARLDAGLTQEEIAEAIGVDQSTVSSWELGRRRPRGPAGLRYAHVLKKLAEASR